MNHTIVVTQYYDYKEAEYASTYSFKLEVKREYLEPKIYYPTVINFKNTSLDVDASGSYGTYDVSTGSTIKCEC